MKNIIYVILLMFTPLVCHAQDQDDHHERIKALKTAFITEGLSLTSEEAQQFWPLYNEYDRNRRNLYRRERAEIDNLECLTESGANAKLSEYVEIEREDYLLKKQYYSDLQKIFTAKRIMQLKKVEDEFNEKMMREYRARKASKN